MRRLNTFDTGKKTYHLEIEYSHPNILTAGSPGRIKRIANYLNDVTFIESDRGLLTIHGAYKGLPVTAFSTGMGPASVSCTLPEIVEACDSDEIHIIRIGTSGALQKYIKVGDLVVTTKVQKAESTSDKIMGKRYIASASPHVVSLLADFSEHYKEDFQTVYIGPTRATDDIYWDAKSSKKRKHGMILAVSMESSAIFAIRDWYNKNDGRNISAGELLSISDNVVAKSKHVDLSRFVENKSQIEHAMIKIGLESLVVLNIGI